MREEWKGKVGGGRRGGGGGKEGMKKRVKEIMRGGRSEGGTDGG